MREAQSLALPHLLRSVSVRDRRVSLCPQEGMRQLAASIGWGPEKKDHAEVKDTWRGTWESFVAFILKHVPETEDKASAGWVCGATFDPPWRESINLTERNFLSLDYDHISEDDFERVLGSWKDTAHLAYTTWSHGSGGPRLRIWAPFSRPVGHDEFEAISRKIVSHTGIELAARESHKPAQYYFRPTVKPFEEFWHWENTQGPWLDPDEILKEYGGDWLDRSKWPRLPKEKLNGERISVDQRTKPGLVGAFARAFTIPAAIERFGLPYVPSSPGRYSYVNGSRADGGRLYDEDTKLHVENGTDAATGQHGAYDLVRIHKFGELDKDCPELAISELPSSRAMAKFASRLPEVQAELMPPESEFPPLGDSDQGNQGSGEESLSALLPKRIPAGATPFCDLGNAGRIQKQYGRKIISVGESFYVWSGTHWKYDKPRVDRYIAELPILVKNEVANHKADFEKDPKDWHEKFLKKGNKWAEQCGQRGTREACARDLATFLTVDGEKLNADTRLLTCLNGTINLQSGELIPHNPVDFITGCAPIEYLPDAEAPRFLQFLEELFETRDIIDFVQRWLGYSLTGSVAAQTVVFHVGEGGNGKLKIMELLYSILGSDYYGTHSKNLLAKQPAAGAPNPDLADLMGKRMVTIPETPDRFEIADDVIKYITGGDAITTRQLNKGNFTFKPTHKLQIFTNHRPRVNGQDHAMWRRIVLLPYKWRYGTVHEFKAGKADRVKDEHLGAKLAKEREGVFAWLVEGAKRWYANASGLDVPECLRLATDQYRREEDVIGRFVEGRIVAEPGAKTPLTGEVGSVYTAYRGWCEEMGHRSYSLPRFLRELLRVIPRAEHTKWRQNGRTIEGIIGLKLTDESLMG